jgi:hypothetical protein
MKYAITLAQDQIDDIMYNYTMMDVEISSESIIQFVREKYHAEYYAFRRELVFHDEKYYNWYILKQE